MSLLAIVTVARNGVASAATKNINPVNIIDVRAATADEITNFSTALTAIVVKTINYNQPATITYLTATATATVLAAVSAAQAGVLGSGVSGQTTLVAGTKAVTIPGLTTSSVVIITLASNANDSLTVKYRAVCTANTLTITALIAAGTINTADTSVVNYAVVG